MSAEYIIEMRDVNKSFYGAKVLYDVNFKLKRGEIRALQAKTARGSLR